MQSSNELAGYINLDDALSRIGGNMSLYKKLLGRFLEGNHFEELEKVLAGGSVDDALRQAHSLKGVSANLSLVKINSYSVQLEQLLKDNADYSSCLEELKEVFRITTEMISGILAF